jgi:periplasmic copper chaperone A
MLTLAGGGTCVWRNASSTIGPCMKNHHKIAVLMAMILAGSGAALAQAIDGHAPRLILAASGMGAEYKVGDLVISAPMAKATPPKAPVSGGYMTITNNGSQSDRLVSVTTPFAPKAEIHEMTMEGDVMKMRPLAGGLEIPAGGSVELKPGGYHIMFMGLTEPLKEGESRKAVLTFEKAGTVEIEFPVMDIKPGGHMQHGG